MSRPSFWNLLQFDYGFSSILTPDYEIPPFSLLLNAITIDPQDLTLNSTSASGDTLYDGANAEGVGAAITNVPYTYSIYQAQNVAINQTFTDDVPGVSYFCAGMFWGGGTLNLLVSTTSSLSRYRYRLIHYTLDLTNGWNFVYNPSTNAILKNYTVSLTDINTAKVFRRRQGTAQYFRANNTIAFGDVAGYTSATTGHLRFQVNDNGTFEINYFELPSIYVTSAVYGDRAGVFDSGGFSELGVFDGDNYFKPASSAQVATSGYPIGNNFSPAREYQYNLWYDALAVDGRRKLLHGTDILLEQFTGGYNIYAFTSEDGSYMFKVSASTVCELAQSPCPTGQSNNLWYMFLKTSYDAEPELIDVMKQVVPNSSLGGASYYIQGLGNGVKATCNRLGDIIVPLGNALAYYKKGSSRAINISSQIGFAPSLIRHKASATTYGFALYGHSNSNIFAVSNINYLTFVQSQTN